MITLLSDSGERLAIGILRAGRAGRILELERILQGKGHLLQYFFGRGKRAVIVESGEFTLRGTLATRWLEEQRLWQVVLEYPRPTPIVVREVANVPAPRQPQN